MYPLEMEDIYRVLEETIRDTGVRRALEVSSERIEKNPMKVLSRYPYLESFREEVRKAKEEVLRKWLRNVAQRHHIELNTESLF